MRAKEITISALLLERRDGMAATRKAWRLYGAGYTHTYNITTKVSRGWATAKDRKGCHESTNYTVSLYPVITPKGMTHLSFMKDSYKDLENQVLKLSREFPKFEGQLEVLETLANTLDATENGWDPKTQEPLPYVGVSLEYSRKHFRGLNKSTQNPYAT
ncbi:hypothetical protein RR46_14285 [Papilio xuthus]|uniref:Uncharacterized protein n=1 Tax=Papilio xuthus TaxID=66420 RepID=A0A194PK13_PAPXU|nr:hypothetical protein RR46_14285 [Papilio xuthus]